MKLTESQLVDLVLRLLRVYENGDLKPSGFAHLWSWIGMIITEGRVRE